MKGEYVGPTCLYRIYDAGDVLLYIGIARFPGVRLAHHRKHQPWRSQVARSEIERYGSREDAALAERLAIWREGPLHNDVRVKPQHTAMPPSEPLAPHSWTGRISSAPDGRLDLMAASEIGRHLRLSPSLVQQIIRESPDFPPPIARLGVGPIWSGAEVREWASAYGCVARAPEESRR